jgi:hypothetical protein
VPILWYDCQRCRLSRFVAAESSADFVLWLRTNPWVEKVCTCRRRIPVNALLFSTLLGKDHQCLSVNHNFTHSFSFFFYQLHLIMVNELLMFFWTKSETNAMCAVLSSWTSTKNTNASTSWRSSRASASGAPQEYVRLRASSWEGTCSLTAPTLPLPPSFWMWVRY